MSRRGGSIVMCLFALGVFFSQAEARLNKQKVLVASNGVPLPSCKEYCTKFASEPRPKGMGWYMYCLVSVFFFRNGNSPLCFHVTHTHTHLSLSLSRGSSAEVHTHAQHFDSPHLFYSILFRHVAGVLQRGPLGACCNNERRRGIGHSSSRFWNCD